LQKKQNKLLEILNNFKLSEEFAENLDNLKLFLLSEAETDISLTKRLVNEGLPDFQMLSPINYILDLKNHFTVEELVFPFDGSKYKGSWYINNNLIDIINVLIEFGAIVIVSEILYITVPNQGVRRNGYVQKKKIIKNFENDCLYHSLNSKCFNEAKYFLNLYPNRFESLMIFKKQCDNKLIQTNRHFLNQEDDIFYLKRIIKIIDCFMHDFKLSGTQMSDAYNYAVDLSYNQNQHKYLTTQLGIELRRKRRQALPPLYTSPNNNLNIAPPEHPPEYKIIEPSTVKSASPLAQGSPFNLNVNHKRVPKLPNYDESQVDYYSHFFENMPGGNRRRLNNKSRKKNKNKKKTKRRSRRR